MLIKTANSLVISKVRAKKIEPINTMMRSIDGNACEQHINQKPLIMFWLCYYSFNTKLIVILLNAPHFTWYSSWWWLDSPLGWINKLLWITQAEHVCTREFAHFYDKFDFTTYFSMRCCHVHHRQEKKAMLNILIKSVKRHVHHITKRSFDCCVISHLMTRYSINSHSGYFRIRIKIRIICYAFRKIWKKKDLI